MKDIVFFWLNLICTCICLFFTEETLAYKVCLLLIELYIVTEQPDIGLSVLNYVESQFVSIDNSKISSVDKDGVMKSVKDQKEQKKGVSDTATDAFKIKLLKYKARIYLLTHQLKLCKKEWKTLVSLGTPVVVIKLFIYCNYIQNEITYCSIIIDTHWCIIIVYIKLVYFFMCNCRKLHENFITLLLFSEHINNFFES